MTNKRKHINILNRENGSHEKKIFKKNSKYIYILITITIFLLFSNIDYLIIILIKILI